ncbi:MAG TPA: thioredoxin-disulfide reductase [Bacteroidales bacterium]|nr:thioredoxin-disulfide reductase [Bacteroidales bacterium]
MAITFGTIGDLNENKNKPADNIGRETEKVNVLIIGSGPAGYTAGIYAARANLKPVLYQGLEPGGQLTTTTEVENFPGYPDGVTGPVLMQDLEAQAKKYGTDIRWGIVTSVDLSKRPFTAIVDEKKKIEAKAIIIATGATAKYLNIDSVNQFKGRGVSACATCDGFFYKNLNVAVVGGGDTACEEASYLAGLAKKVYLIVRKPYLRASKAMQERVKKTPNIEILFEHVTKEVYGNDEGVLGLKLIKQGKETVDIEVSGFFMGIGHEPQSKIFKPWIETDDTGYIKTIPGTSKTNIPGVFAAGDVQDPVYRQAVTAAGSGCMAALDVEKFLTNL